MIYFAVAHQAKAVKIGFAKDPQARIRELQTGCPCAVELAGVLPGDRNTERELHQKYAAHRLQGEWFTLEGVKDILPTLSAVPETAGNKQINLRISDELLELVDRTRGSTPRNTYLVRLLKEALPARDRPEGTEPTQTSRADMFRAANKRR